MDGRPPGPKIHPTPWQIKFKIDDQGNQVYDEKAYMRERRVQEIWEALLSADPQKITRKATGRLLDYARIHAELPWQYFISVKAANNHHFFKDALDLTMQSLRQDWPQSVDKAWQRRILIEAMKGLTPLPGFWKNVLSLLQDAGHHVDLLQESWNEAQLAAAGLCQELKWQNALNILEVTSQRRSLQDMLCPPDISESKMRCAAAARRWALAFSTWRAARRHDTAPWVADEEASALIGIFEDRLDRSSSWSLGLELLQELRRQRSAITKSAVGALQLCSRSSQWATVLALGGVEGIEAMPQVQVSRFWRKYESSDVFSTYHLIKASCRSRLWQESLSLLEMLPTHEQAAMWETRYMVKAYHQVILACGRCSQVQKAVEVFRHQSDPRQQWQDPILLNALLTVLLEADPRDLSSLGDPCGQVIQLFDRLEQVQLTEDLLTKQALLKFLEDFNRPEAALPILYTLEGELRLLARNNALNQNAPSKRSEDDFGIPMAIESLEKGRLEIEKAWQILEASGCEISDHWSRYLLGSFSWQLPTRQDLSSFTCRSLLTDHCDLPMEAPWSCTGSRSLRKLLGEANRLEMDREDVNWSCYAWIQFEIFLPAVSRSRGGLPSRSITPLAEPRGRWLSCRGRAVGNRQASRNVCSQDREHYGPPLSVRNALLQVIAMAERVHFGHIYKSGNGDFGWIWCPELGDVFFAPRLLPHDEWKWGQEVSFALDYNDNRRGRPKAVKLSFEETVPPLVSIFDRRFN